MECHSWDIRRHFPQTVVDGPGSSCDVDGVRCYTWDIDYFDDLWSCGRRHRDRKDAVIDVEQGIDCDDSHFQWIFHIPNDQ